MLVSEYNDFVQRTDKYAGKPGPVRWDIAVYGLVGELGSVMSAIKKQLLGEGGQERLEYANEEIVEELGDVVWYCFSLAQIANEGRRVNVFTQNIAFLKNELTSSEERSTRVRAVLDWSKKDEFLSIASRFPNTEHMCFRDYQDLAFLTARTEGEELLKVCLTVLWQLGAELLYRGMPASERELNPLFAERNINLIIGDIAWHVAAIASLYGLSLDDVVETNCAKVEPRLLRGHPTPLHDDGRESDEQFPRQMEISFITTGPGRARMYFAGRQLGDDLTDNSYEDDGYRFHDVLHWANVAKLCWSPVMRGFMGKKRKSNKKLDEVEDGARAKLIEEVVIKAIHSEGVRLAKQRPPGRRGKPLFQTEDDISFKFLKSAREIVEGLEVYRNKPWEWEDAIKEGYAIFHKLCGEGQGSVDIDLNRRSIQFRPEVFIDLNGVVAGVGSGSVEPRITQDPGCGLLDKLTDFEISRASGDGAQRSDEIGRLVAAKLAILDAIGISGSGASECALLELRLDGNRVSTKAKGMVQKAFWANKVVSFRLTINKAHGVISCTALALADSADSAKGKSK